MKPLRPAAEVANAVHAAPNPRAALPIIEADRAAVLAAVAVLADGWGFEAGQYARAIRELRALAQPKKEKAR